MKKSQRIKLYTMLEEADIAYDAGQRNERIIERHNTMIDIMVELGMDDAYEEWFYDRHGHYPHG